MIVIYGVIQSVGLDDSDNRISFIGDMTVCTDGTGHSCNVAPQLHGNLPPNPLATLNARFR